MSMGCIAIQIDQHEPILVELDKLGYLHMVGVAGGNLMIMAGSPKVDEAFSSYRWPELPITDTSQIVVHFAEPSESTAPSVSENQTVSELEERIRKGFEELKHLEERAQNMVEQTNKTEAKRPRTSHIQVFRNVEPLFAISGEHVQFEVNWKPSNGAKISVWAQERYEDDSPKDHFVSEIGGADEYVIRFGS